MTNDERDSEIRKAFAESMATQMILTGLMSGLLAKGVINIGFCKKLFDHVEDVAVSMSYKLAPVDSGQSPHALNVIEQLRKSVIGDN